LKQGEAKKDKEDNNKKIITNNNFKVGVGDESKFPPIALYSPQSLTVLANLVSVKSVVVSALLYFKIA
jgi:hypothetical protein